MFYKKKEKQIRPEIQEIVESKNFDSIQFVDGAWELKHKTENICIRWIWGSYFNLYVNNKAIILTEDELNLLYDKVNHRIEFFRYQESTLAYE